MFVEAVSAPKSIDLFVKCCLNDYVLDDALDKCVQHQGNFTGLLQSINDTDLGYLAYFSDGENNTIFCDQTKNETSCYDQLRNGSFVIQNCSRIKSSQSIEQCDSIFTLLNFWGASMMIFACYIYMVPYASVSTMYILVSTFRRRAYDKIVLCYAIAQTVQSLEIAVLGHLIICHVPLSDTAMSLFGLSLMFLTVSSCLWLLVISFDMTLTITRFRWAPSSDSSGRAEHRKFCVYTAWVMGGSLIPTGLTTFVELVPFISEDYVIKPHFAKFHEMNVAVIVYVASIPVLVAIASAILFVHTTVKMISIQRSTSGITKNRKESTKEKYIMYLRLYLMMDAPYISGALGAIYEELWIFKFFRMIHPLLMLYAVIPRKTMVKVFEFCKKSKPPEIDKTTVVVKRKKSHVNRHSEVTHF